MDLEDGHRMNQERKDLLRYSAAVLVLTTLICWVFAVAHVTSNWAYNALMFVPGLLALAFLLWKKEKISSVGLRLGPARFWLLGALLPCAVLALSLPLDLLLGYAAQADPTSPGGPLLHQPVRLLKNMAIYLVISFPLALGEEFGWRGYCQNRMIRQFGLVAGLVLLGLLWGFWHSPIYYVMQQYPDHPLLGCFVMTPLDNLMVVVPMAWLYIRSGSIWVPTFTHAFADILWGFSGLLFPPRQEIHGWVVLQILQLILSAILLLDLMRRPQARQNGIQSNPAV